MTAVVNTHRAGAPSFQILGPLRFRRDGAEQEIGPPQQSHVLALLLAGAGRPVSAGELIDMVWGEEAPMSALNILHKYVGSLRRLLEPALLPRETGAYLLRRGNGYALAADPDAVDLSRFRHLVRSARAEQAAGRPAEALDHYTEALRLWQGSTAESLPPGPATTPIAIALDEEFYAACGRAAVLAAELGRPGRVLPALRMAARMAPLHEQVRADLIGALAADGQQAEALAAFEGIRNLLAEDLGIDPGPVLREAHRRVLRRPAAPGAAALVRPARPAQLPPALPAFVGRAEELAALTGRLAESRTSPMIVALHGVGGVGKSTLATQFAHLVAGRFPDGQLYLDLRGSAPEHAGLSPTRALHAFLTALGMPAAAVPETVEARTGTYRSRIAGKRVLVVLDNVSDVSQVRPLLPNSAGCLILVTSREPLIDLAAFEGADLLHVELPDTATARALFRRRLAHSPHRPVAALAADAELVREVVERCERLPLALALVAGQLSAGGTATATASWRDDQRPELRRAA
ncbi:BTAD domain-containing putative transcriptional regulator [Actinoplanes sp. NPDC020271]|uniref:AfsR/SARP family transcriptional regulator n=1 Tax=Actinoplanes sp. NPDC020271 TaxID=3363896 RepID=UPI0037A25C04